MIEKTSDDDVFSFPVAKASLVTLAVTVPAGINNLDAKAALFDASGTALATADPANSFSASIARNLEIGTYYLRVSSHGGYGDVGQYAVSGTGTFALPDLTISKMEVGKTRTDGTFVAGNTFLSGEVLTVKATLRNIGTANAARSSWTRFDVDASTTGNLGFVSTPALKMGTDVTLTSKPWTATVGTHTFIACADQKNAKVTPPGPFITESDESMASNCNYTTATVAQGPDTIPPTITITNPKNAGAVAKNTTITIKATAKDNVGGTGVAKAQFFVNGVTPTTCGTPDDIAPYACQWKIPNVRGKVYRIKATAWDKANYSRTSPVVSVTTQ